MPALTAAQRLKKKFGPFPATVDGVEVVLRRPDVRYMIYTRTLPVPLLEKVGTLLSTWVGQDLSKLAEEARDSGGEALEILDTLVCVSVVDPKVVMTPEEVVDDTMICVRELDVDFKERCLLRAMEGGKADKIEVDAASRFPGDGRGEGTAQDVQSVRPETVERHRDPEPSVSA